MNQGGPFMSKPRKISKNGIHLIFDQNLVAHLNMDMPSYQYKNSHYKDKIFSGPSYVSNGIPGKNVFILWRHPDGFLPENSCEYIILRVAALFDSKGNEINHAKWRNCDMDK